ncbi:MAG: magnesium transporter [Candidatus Diapherotrites archaeon]
MDGQKGNGLHNHLKKWLVTEVPVIEKSKTIDEAFSIIRKHEKELKSIEEIYVIDESQKLVGTLPIKELFGHAGGTTLEKAMHTKFFSVSPKTCPERIAHLALKHGIAAAPVVESGKLLGAIPSGSIASILNRALRKDLFHFAGIHKSHLEYENSMAVPLSKSIAHRVPWLIIGLLGALLVAASMGVFEGTLEKYIILVFFMPAIVYLSDALGTQLQTIFIRDLAIMGEELKMRQYVFRQMAIALLIALIISGLLLGAVSLFWGQPHIAAVISISAFAALIITSFTALAITAIIRKIGHDPALGGGPFATIISDATSIMVYFAVATLLL